MLRESIVLKGTGFKQEQELENVGHTSRGGNKSVNIELERVVLVSIYFNCDTYIILYKQR